MRRPARAHSMRTGSAHVRPPPGTPRAGVAAAPSAPRPRLAGWGRGYAQDATYSLRAAGTGPRLSVRPRTPVAVVTEASEA